MTYPSDPAPSIDQSDSPPSYSSNETTTLAAPSTETVAPISASSAYGDSSAFDTNSAGQSTADSAKQQASEVGDSAAQAGQQVAAKAKDEAANVAAEAKSQAKNMLQQTRDEVSSQAGTQQQRVAEGLRTLSSELQSMSDRSEQDGPAVQVARQAADRLGSAASWLEGRDPGQVMNDLRQFARQRPGAFLALAATAGLVAGRLTRGITADKGSGHSTATQGSDSLSEAATSYDTGADRYGTDGGAVSPIAPAFGSGAAPAQESWTEGQASDVTGNYSSDAAGTADYGQPGSTVYIDPTTGRSS